MKRGYRLTPEEEAMIRGEKPETLTSPELPTQPTPAKNRTLRSVLPLIAIFLGMILIANGVIAHFGGFSSRERPEPAIEEALYQQSLLFPGEAAAYGLTAEQIASFAERLALSPEENTAFWPLYFRFRRETLDWEVSHRKQLSAWMKAAVEPAPVTSFENLYISDIEEYIKIAERYLPDFKRILSEKRVPLVLEFHETNWPLNPLVRH